MPRKQTKTPAADAFASLGLEESEWTDAMRLAVKQRWTDLPVEEKVDDLRARLAALPAPSWPSARDLAASGFGHDDASGVIDLKACEAEEKRLKRNAGVNHWRTKNQLRAALDARELKFAKLRSKRAAVADPDSAKADV